VSLLVEDYPRTLVEFEARFATEAACRAYLAQLRWPDGFRCPKCGGTTAWPVRNVLWECGGCGRQTSVTAGTVFQDTRTPLTAWFRAMWWVTNSKAGTSALTLQHLLGLGSYQTAWTWLHKLRRAMVRPGRDRLSGEVEVDETLLGGLGGAQGRSTATKALIVVAAEVVGRGTGRIRMRRIPDGSAPTLQAFVEEAIERGSTVHTDGWDGYERVKANGYRHRVSFLRGHPELGSERLPRVHRVVSLLKRWLLGTHQGAVSRAHLDYYLDEFTFRFNRRTSRHRGKLFFRLVQQAVAVAPVPYARLVRPDGRRRARRHKRLGSPE
jgi:transposase-like protein/ribosomal protein L37AE/L43A